MLSWSGCKGFRVNLNYSHLQNINIRLIILRKWPQWGKGCHSTVLPHLLWFCVSLRQWNHDSWCNFCSAFSEPDKSASCLSLKTSKSVTSRSHFLLVESLAKWKNITPSLGDKAGWWCRYLFVSDRQTTVTEQMLPSSKSNTSNTCVRTTNSFFYLPIKTVQAGHLKSSGVSLMW